ncbi:MAG: branched-chain amino acid transport system substrate-binding protein [Mycobacteriales bacterium]
MLVAVASLLAACGSSKSSAGSDASSGGGNAEPYVWGINAELSGPVSCYGDRIAKGVEAYVSQVNAKGGINGRQVKLVKLDNAASESRAHQPGDRPGGRQGRRERQCHVRGHV